ncbi:MAG TPA: hypothetical protein VMF35_11050 [Acidimicrobiales bacterium]|nr:hypothetical protein [Acidimicrobiales bacterium]
MRKAAAWVGARPVPVMVTVFVALEGAASYWVASATHGWTHVHLARWLPAMTAAVFAVAVLACVSLRRTTTGRAHMSRLARAVHESSGTTISHVHLLGGPLVALAPVVRAAPVSRVAPRSRPVALAGYGAVAGVPLRPRHVPTPAGAAGVAGAPGFGVTGVRVYPAAGCRNVTVT